MASMPEKGEDSSLGFIKKRIVFKVDGNAYQGQRPVWKQQMIDIKSNTATLLKEVAVVLKEEEEETKKLLDLLIGSPNYLEYERLIEERIEEEKEFFRLKIERLHLEGKLTEQAAILAKQRLLHESKIRRKLFEEERKKYLDDVEKLKAIEKERALNLFSKVKEINRRAQMQKQKVFEVRKTETQKTREDIQKLLKEAIAKGKEEYQKKVLIIKEIRAFQAFKKSLGCESFKKPKETPKLGLLCEMSLEELASRKALMKTSLEEERTKRRKEILERIKQKEIFLDYAETFVRKVRQRKNMKRLSKLHSDSRKLSKEVNQIIPKSFLRQIPPITDTEENYKKLLKKFQTIEKQAKDQRIIDAKRKQALCESKAKKDAEILNRVLLARFEGNLDKNKAPRELISMEKSFAPDNEDKFGKGLSVTKKVSANKKDIGINEATKETTLKITKQAILWKQFKKFVSIGDRYKFPKRYADLDYPPKKWLKGTVSKTQLSWSADRKKKKKAPLRSQRILQFKKKGTRKRKTRGYRKSHMTEKLWIELWHWFCDNLAGEIKEFDKLDDSHTKNIVEKVTYFHQLLNKKHVKEQPKKINPHLEKYREGISKLKRKLKELQHGIIKSTRENEPCLNKAFRSRHYNKPKTPLRHRLVQNETMLKDYSDFYRSFQSTIPTRYTEPDIFAEEDNEIKVTDLQIPRGEELTRVWLTEKEQEKKQLREFVPQTATCASVIHAWQIPKRKKKEVKNKRELPLEFKLLTQYSNRYKLLRNKFGNPVFILRPMKSSPTKWEWVPVITRKRDDEEENEETNDKIKDRMIKGAFEDTNEAIEKVKAVNTAVMAYIRMTTKRRSLLPKMLASRYQSDHKYMPGMRGVTRQRYFANVPIRMILDYWTTHRYGGDPEETPPSENGTVNTPY